MPYESPISGRNPANPVTLNDARIVEEEMNSVAIDTATPEWTEAMQYILAHPTAQDASFIEDHAAQLRLADEVAEKFQIDVETSADIVEEALGLLRGESPSAESGPIGEPVQSAVEKGAPEIVKFQVDLSREFDSEQDIIDDISAMYGQFQQSWDFVNADWAIGDDGTIAVKLLTPRRSAAAEPVTKPSLDEMLQHRVALQKKMEEINDQVSALQTALEATIAEQQQVVQQEEPALMALLEKLPDYKAVVDGWEVLLSTRSASSRIKYKDVLAQVDAKAKKVAPALSKLISQLKGTAKYLTPIPESRSVEVRRQESLVTADGGLQGLWNQFKQWVASIFAPLAQELDQDFQELQDYQTMVQGDSNA